MVKINTAVKTFETSFKTIEGSKLTVKHGLTAGEFEGVMNSVGGNFESPEMVTKVLSCLIQDWNLEGDDGEKLKITQENLKKIDLYELINVFQQTDFGKRSKELAEKKAK